ncbi:MAG: hypothetical protein AB7S44_00935 [Spirochaetales bacterium]
MSTELLIALIASIGTGVSALFAGLAISASRQDSKNHYKHAHCDKLQKWYEKTLQSLKDLHYLGNGNTEDIKNKKNLLLSRLSTNIDIGRQYFGNTFIDDKGANKPELFKGYRAVIIDLLILYHQAYEFEANKKEINYAALRNIERAFVSETTLYIKRLEKSRNIVPYDLIDKNGVLQFENFKKPESDYIFDREDIITYVRYANKTGEKLPPENTITKLSEREKKEIMFTPASSAEETKNCFRSRKEKKPVSTEEVVK